MHPSHRSWPTLHQAAPFKVYQHAPEVDREGTAINVATTNKAASLEREWIDTRNETTVEGTLARDLFKGGRIPWPC